LLETFLKTTGQNTNLPINEKMINEFCHWALTVRKLRPSTVKAYLQSITIVHKINGFGNYNCNNAIANLIIKGAENMTLYGSNAKKVVNKCNVVTLNMLKIIGHKIALTQWDEITKQIVWVTALVAFFGSCRIGELLPENSCYDSETSLLWGDLTRLENSWVLHIKSTKNRTKGGEFIDIFEFKGHNCCPVKALDKLYDLSVYSKNKKSAVFTFNNGKVFTKINFNRTLNELLKEDLKKVGGVIRGHSFRAGIPSILAKYPELVNDGLIKKWGRWNSDTYKTYTRLKNSQKLSIFKNISSILNKD